MGVSGLEIIHGGVGGDVELGARTSEHILVFAFDPVSLTLSLFYLCKASFISYHIVYACVVLALIHIAYSLYAWIACVYLACT